MFVASRDAFAAMDGWEHRLWGEEAVGGLIDVYHGLRYPVQRVDVAKYAIADAHGGVVCDIVVSPCTFDRCSRRNVLANDFLYIETGLVGIFEDFAANLARVEAIPVYTHWKMHYAFQTTGPKYYTRYLKRAGLARNAQRLSARSFLDPRQRHREVALPDAKLEIAHHLSWLPQVRDAGTGGPRRGGRVTGSSRGARGPSPTGGERLPLGSGWRLRWSAAFRPASTLCGFRRRGRPVCLASSSGASHCGGLLVVMF